MINIYFSSLLWIIIFLMNVILTFVIIFLERKSPQSTFSWIFFVWFIPIIGFVFYLYLSQNLTRRRIFKYNTPENKEYHSQLEKQHLALIEQQRISKHSDLVNQYRRNIEYHVSVSHALYTENNQVTVITDGHDKFEQLFEAIRAAQNNIHIEYYIIKNDNIGNRLIQLLIQKAHEGVEVRLLFDEMGGRYLPHHLLKQFENAGGKYGIFFPSKFKHLNLRINYRDHRKLVIIDGKTGFIGGFNVGDEYLGLNKKMGYWRDTHLKIKGHAVYELQIRFMLDWRTSSKEHRLDITSTNSPLYFPHMKDIPGSGVQIVSSGPDSQNQVIKQGFLRMINNAKKYILIQTPYFIPDESIKEALKIALMSGIDVQIMLPNKPDHAFVYWASLSYAGELIDYGGKIFIYNNGFLHSKTIVVDDDIAAVGTCNFDIRSFSLNFESNAFIYDPKIAVELRENFEKDIEKSLYYDVQTYNQRSKFRYIRESVSRLASPLL